MILLNILAMIISFALFLRSGIKYGNNKYMFMILAISILNGIIVYNYFN